MDRQMNVKELIPKHKHDHKVITGLKNLSFEQIEPIIPALLEWIQDMNWPIARQVADILEPFVDRITPEIIKMLRTDDILWKYWILISLLRKTTDPVVLAEIERLAKHPSKDEIENDVHIEAAAILNGDHK